MPAAADIFRQAAELNREDSRREGNTVRLGGDCQITVAGDIHGHRPNLARIISYANLTNDARRYLVLQEIIHAPVDPASGQDRSIEPLLRAVRLKCAHPEQVLFLLGNHDVAQITGNEIMKGGQSYCKTFIEGVKYAFGDEDSHEILSAVNEFLLSMPLAVRCDNGVLIAHSAPSPKRMEAAGTDILRRAYRDEDLARGGAAYEWTWGRGHTPEQLDALAAELGMDFFVLGHQHVSSGLEVISPRAVTLASDHPHGKILHFSTDAPLTAEAAVEKAKPIVAL